MKTHDLTAASAFPACPLVPAPSRPIRKLSLTQARNESRRRQLDRWRISLGDALIALACGLDDRPRLALMPNTRGLSKEIRVLNVYGALADHVDPVVAHTRTRDPNAFPSNPDKRRPKGWAPRHHG